MAITVKDIQETEFAFTSENGYNPDQVDDFLDAVAAELGSAQAENQSLKAQVAELQAALENTEAAKSEIEKKLPDYNENGYFKNLESAMRESLIGAQRIADQTLGEANKKAEQTITDANAKAEKTVADADAQAAQTIADAKAKAAHLVETAEKKVADLTAQAEEIRSTAANYRAGFKKLVEDHLAVLDKYPEE